MRIVFLVEERSMKELLQCVLPKILPENMETLIIPHSGKSDLVASIPRKLQSWPFPDDKFVIVHDQDSADCTALKESLLNLCSGSKNEYLVRIACRELEAWYFGDLAAVSKAYGKNFEGLSRKRKYRVPDGIGNAKDELRKIIPSHQQILGAQLIGTYMKPEINTSRSFQVFVSGVQRLCSSKMA